MTIAFQFRLHCPLCKESITLPRRSPVGIQQTNKYDPTPGSWPITLICIPYELVCKCPYDKVERIDFEEQGRNESPAAVWEIVCGCGRESCDTGLTACTLWDLAEASRDQLLDRIIKARPTASCSSGHDIEWKPARMKATMLPF
jgi:hypothetical protein